MVHYVLICPLDLDEAQHNRLLTNVHYPTGPSLLAAVVEIKVLYCFYTIDIDDLPYSSIIKRVQQVTSCARVFGVLKVFI